MSASGDLYFSDVQLLLEGNSYTDVSNNALNTIHTGVSITDTLPSIVGSSFLFPEGLTGLPLSIVAPSSCHIQSGQDFTIELSAYCAPNQLGSALFSNRVASGSAVGLLIGLDPDGRPFVRATSSGMLVVAIDAPAPVTLNAIHAFALGRINGVWTLFVDGRPVIDIRHNSTWAGAIDYGPSIYIGCDPYTAPFVGGINQVRMTLSVGRYSGLYAVSTVRFPLYSAVTSIEFSALSSNVSQASRSFSTTVNITNATNTTVSVVDGSGNAVGSGWTISALTINEPTHWTISGTTPAALAGYSIKIHAWITIDSVVMASDATFSIMNTLNGVLSPEQEIVLRSNSLALWLDASDDSTITVDSGQVIEVLDKANSVIFTNANGGDAPTVDAVSFSSNSLNFGTGVSSGLVSTTPVPVSSANGGSTIFLVGKYNGVQVGQGSGLFQLATAKDATLMDGSATYALATTTVGTNNASVLAYDNRTIQDGISTSPTIAPDAKFLVVWKSSLGAIQIYVNQHLITTVTLTGDNTIWAVLNSAIGFIGGSQSPTGSFISVGEILAFTSTLSASDTENIESYLNHKWDLFPIRPFAQTPSVLTGYRGSNYSATTLVSDATSVSVSASDGSDWAIALTSSSPTIGYKLTGIVPGVSGEVSSIVSTLNGTLSGITWTIDPTNYGSISTYTVSGVISSLVDLLTLLPQLLQAYIPSSTWTIGSTGSGSFTAYSITGAVAPTTLLRNLTNDLLLSAIPDGDWTETSSPAGASTPTAYSYSINSQNASDIFALIDATLSKLAAGSSWTLLPTSPYAQIPYTITGVLPNTVETITITITSSDSATGIANSNVYPISVLQIPNYPIISSPENLECQVAFRYISTINILNADSVSVSSNGGSNWAINVAPTGAQGNYVITGTMPNGVGTIVLTVTATKNVSGGVPVVVIGLFTVIVTAAGDAVILPYPLDLTGLLSTNRILNEKQTLTPYNGPKKQLLVPILTPFFGNSLVVQYYNTHGDLVTADVGVDYELVFQYEAFTNIAQSPIYGGVSFMNVGIVGLVLLSYQTVGGNFALNKKTLIEQLFISSSNPDYITWNSILNKPAFFPVDHHELNVQNHSVGWSSLDTATMALAEATVSSPTDSDVGPMGIHATTTGNPHGVTKAQLGLGNVQNYPVATDVQAISPINSSVYLTPHTAYLGANANLVMATNTVQGKDVLNLGLTAGDDTDTAKALTAQGLINLLDSGTSNAINSLLAGLGIVSQVEAQVSPHPVVFPLWWKGVQYSDLANFIAGVETLVGIAPIPYDNATSTFYFPVGITVPSLTTSTTNNMVSPSRLTVKGTARDALIVGV